MRIEILNDKNEVVNTIVADEEFAEEHFPGMWRIAEIQERPDAPQEIKRYITVGAFYDRFGAEKWEILSSTDPIVQALIKDASVRSYIDLDRSDLLDALNLIKTKGFDIDPQKIVSDPILDSERK